MASIPLPALHVQTPDTQGPLDQYSKILQLKNMLNQGQLQQANLEGQNLQNKQLATAEQEHQAAQQAIQEANGDVKAALPKIMKVAPTYGMQLQKQITEWDSADIKKKQEILKLQQEKTSRLGQLAGSVTDPNSYNQAVQTAVSEGLVDEQTGQSYLQKGYDPNFVKGLQTQALTAQQQLAQKADELKQQETERHNKAMETKPSEALQGLNDFLKTKEAAKGSPLTAQEGLAAREEYYKRNKSQTNINAGSSGNDPKDIAQAIIRGEQPPTVTGLYKNAAPVRAELARAGFNLQRAESDWKAVQKHLSTLNGAQQERLRQAVTFTYDSLDNIESLYKEWKQLGPNSGLKILNRAALATAKQLPGRPGAVAQALEAQINDLTSELGTVYKGGNASTDETLRLAAENLKADWNEETFRRGIQQIRTNLGIRKNSILHSEAAGVSEGSPYTPNPSTNTPQAQPVGGSFWDKYPKVN